MHTYLLSIELTRHKRIVPVTKQPREPRAAPPPPDCHPNSPLTPHPERRLDGHGAGGSGNQQLAPS